MVGATHIPVRLHAHLRSVFPARALLPDQPMCMPQPSGARECGRTRPGAGCAPSAASAAPLPPGARSRSGPSRGKNRRVRPGTHHTTAVTHASHEAGDLQVRAVWRWRARRLVSAMPGSPAESVCVRCRETWDMTEAAALNLLEDFVNRKLEIYESSRALARGDAVSRLSPYLHFGQISPRTVMARLAAAGAKAVSKTFWRRLVWRDLAYWQLHHWPAMPARSIRPAYERQEWAFDARVLRRWHAGRTGFPLVDAGMRELWRTGYMHQNVRMVVACFLTEYLNFHWVHGARWFHDTLVDADLAINSMMWQNAGKSGLDQWNFSVLPYSKSADSKGDYIRRCVRRPRRPGISRRRSRCHPRVLPHRLGRLRGRT